MTRTGELSIRRLLDRGRLANPLPQGTGAVGVGLIVAGLSAYGFLVLSARALGPEEWAALSVLWAMVFTAGPGFFLPLEQEISRALASRRAEGHGAGPLIVRAAALGGALAALVVAATLAAGDVLLDHLFDGEALLLVGFVIGLLGYVVLHLARGVLSGMRRFDGYATCIGAEGAVRLLACAVLALAGVASAGPFGLALGGAPLVAVAIALRGQRGLLGPGPPAPWAELGTALGALLAGSVLAQLLANIGPLAVEVLASEAESDEAGRFLAGLVVARVPLFLFGAVQAALLPRLSELAGSGRLADFRAGLARLLRVLAGLGILAVVAAFAVGPRVVPIFGSDFRLGHRDMGVLAAATVAYILALTLAQALIALAAPGRMALGWLAGVATFVVVASLGSDLFLRVELGLLAGSVATATLMAAMVATRLRSGARAAPGDLVTALHDVALEP